MDNILTTAMKLLVIILSSYIGKKWCYMDDKYKNVEIRLQCTGYTSPAIECDQRVNMFVCMYVCLSVRSHISKTTCANFIKFSVQVSCDRGSALL